MGSLVLPALLLAAGLTLLLLPDGNWAPWRRGLGAAIAAVAMLAAVAIVLLARQPRLAYRPGELLVYLAPPRPIAVPIEIVEGFFLGAGPSFLPGPAKDQLQTANLVIRLADRAPDWAQREVRPELGAWCGGYITLRGTWCEPLTLDLVQRLNARLAEVTRVVASSRSPP
jgi:hypothetical protein